MRFKCLILQKLMGEDAYLQAYIHSVQINLVIFVSSGFSI